MQKTAVYSICGATLLAIINGGCSSLLSHPSKTTTETPSHTQSADKGQIAASSGVAPMPISATQATESLAHAAAVAVDDALADLATDPFSVPALATLEAEQLPPFATASIWDRIRAGFRFPDIQHPRIETELAFYRRYPDYLRRVTERAEPFLHFILEEVEKRDLPTELVLLPIVESAYQVFAYSQGRAAGIWQFIPSTGELFGLKQNWWYDGRRDVYASTQAAMDFLSRLETRFEGDWLHALAAYNSGDGTVLRAIRANRQHNRPTDFWSLNLPKETRSYVPKLLAIKMIFTDPETYGLELPEIADEPHLATVEVGGQIDLALAAELAGLSVTDLYNYNPGFNRWATDPDGPHRLLLPLENAANFTRALDEIPLEKRVTWRRYQVKSGQTLSEIARETRTTVEHLKAINGLDGSRIRAGSHLLVPYATKDAAAYTLSHTQRQQKLQNAERQGKKIIHVVQSGDTLWGLAQRYGVTAQKLASWNGLAPRDVIRPGQELVLWLKGSEMKKTAFTLPGGHYLPQNEVIRSIRYTVRKGDSLARIAARFNVSIKELQRWNPNLNKTRYLQPGEQLTLYVDIRKQSS